MSGQGRPDVGKPCEAPTVESAGLPPGHARVRPGPAGAPPGRADRWEDRRTARRSRRTVGWRSGTRASPRGKPVRSSPPRVRFDDQDRRILTQPSTYPSSTPPSGRSRPRWTLSRFKRLWHLCFQSHNLTKGEKMKKSKTNLILIMLSMVLLGVSPTMAQPAPPPAAPPVQVPVLSAAQSLCSQSSAAMQLPTLFPTPKPANHDSQHCGPCSSAQCPNLWAGDPCLVQSSAGFKQGTCTPWSVCTDSSTYCKCVIDRIDPW
jgi:hypothetical protein